MRRCRFRKDWRRLVVEGKVPTGDFTTEAEGSSNSSYQIVDLAEDATSSLRDWLECSG